MLTGAISTEEVTMSTDIYNKKLEAVSYSLRKLTSLHNQTKNQYSKKHNICDIYYKEGKQKRAVISNVWKQFTNVGYDDVTLVTQMSIDKMPSLIRILKTWTGPVSVAFYIKLNTSQSALESIMSETSVVSKDNMDIHLVAGFGVSSIK